MDGRTFKRHQLELDSLPLPPPLPEPSSLHRFPSCNQILFARSPSPSPPDSQPVFETLAAAEGLLLHPPEQPLSKNADDYTYAEQLDFEESRTVEMMMQAVMDDYGVDWGGLDSTGEVVQEIENDQTLDDAQPPLAPIPPTIPFIECPPWPFPVPSTSAYFNPRSSGVHTHSPPLSSARRTLRTYMLPLLTHALAGIFNVARRANELVLQIGSECMKQGQDDMLDRVCEWYRQKHPEEGEDGVDHLLEFCRSHPLPDPAPRSQRTALKQLNVDDSVIVHPQCANANCSHVFYDIHSVDRFEQLPSHCPDCHQPLRDSRYQLTVLQYPRRSLQSELEHVLGIAGVERAIQNGRSRKRKRDEEDERQNSTTGSHYKVYRQQDDGSAWRPPDASAEDRNTLYLVLNLAIDWANTSSRRGSSVDSMGPILLTVASLPPELRPHMACVLLMGITPAPSMPKGRNLWKLLLPLAVELREAEMRGLWICTADYPTGEMLFEGRR